MNYFLTTPLAIFLVGVFGVVAGAQSTVITSKSPQASARSEAGFRVSPTSPWEPFFLRPQPSITSGPRPLGELVDQLRAAGVPIVLGQSARYDSADEKAVVELPSPDLRLLDRLNIGLAERNACIAFVNEIPQIISIDEASDPKYFTTRVYDVSRLAVKVQTLVNMIQNTIDTDGWQDTGQGLSTISGLESSTRKLLVIAAPYSAHRSIRTLLGQIPVRDGPILPPVSLAAGSSAIALPGAPAMTRRVQRQRARPAFRGGGGFGGGGGIF